MIQTLIQLQCEYTNYSRQLKIQKGNYIQFAPKKVVPDVSGLAGRRVSGQGQWKRQ